MRKPDFENVVVQAISYDQSMRHGLTLHCWWQQCISESMHGICRYLKGFPDSAEEVWSLSPDHRMQILYFTLRSGQWLRSCFESPFGGYHFSPHLFGPEILKRYVGTIWSCLVSAFEEKPPRWPNYQDTYFKSQVLHFLSWFFYFLKRKITLHYLLIFF